MADSPTPARPIGAYTIYPANRGGTYIEQEIDVIVDGKPAKEMVPSDPSGSEAVDIYFSINNSQEAPPKDQMDLQDDIGQVLDTVRAIYLRDGDELPPFRLFYMRLFRLAQLGLEGNALPDAARAILDRVIDDLLRAEGPRVKNMHLKQLAKAVGWLGAAASLAYVVFRSVGLQDYLAAFDIDGVVASSFAMIWLGCFIGVWLSYAIRKSVFKLRDLTVGEDDFLEPLTRLVFAGLLANFVAFLLLFDVIKIAIGTFSLNDFFNNPSRALLIGMVLGVNELLLPSAVANRSRELIDKL